MHEDLKNVYALLLANPRLTVLKKLVDLLDPKFKLMLESFDPEVTLIAPTNDAFKNLVTTMNITFDELLMNRDLITKVLNYHIIEDKFTREKLLLHKDQPLKTDLGVDLQLVSFEQSLVLVDKKNTQAKILEVDEAGNGSIIIIDRVLLPE